MCALFVFVTVARISDTRKKRRSNSVTEPEGDPTLPCAGIQIHCFSSKTGATCAMITQLSARKKIHASQPALPSAKSNRSCSVGIAQKFKPPSRAPSARAAMRPWYTFPLRSKNTCETRSTWASSH